MAEESLRFTRNVSKTQPRKKIRLKRLPDQSEFVDTGSARVGRVRRSPIRYEIVFTDAGPDIVNSSTGEPVGSEEKAVITDSLIAGNLAKERQAKMLGSDYMGIPRRSGEDMTRGIRQRATYPEDMYSTDTNRTGGNIYVKTPDEPQYRPLRGYSAPEADRIPRMRARRSVYGPRSGDRTINVEPVHDYQGINEDAYRGDPDSPAGWDLLEGSGALTDPNLMAYGGPVKKRKKAKRQSGRVKKYAKGGGIRRAKY